MIDLQKPLKKSKNEPSGVSVKPGTYKAVMTYGDQTSETMITVKDDPRINVNSKNTDEVYSALKDIENIRQTMADAVKQLVESKNTAEKYKKDLSKLDKKKYKEQIKASKDVIKKIDDVLAIYFGKEDKRQGITRSNIPTVNSRLSIANSYTRSRKNGITTTETTLVKHAKNALNKALKQTNELFENDWKPYQTSIESLDISAFKDLKTFSLD